MHRLLVLLLCLPTVAGAPLLSGVVPDLPGPGPGDEGVAVWSPVAVDLSGWSLSDGESRWLVPEGVVLEAGKEAWFVGDGAAWRAHGGKEPVGEFDLVLGNDGDDVRLMDPSGTIVDSFAWGDGSAPGVAGSVSYVSPGLVYRRLAAGEGWLDTGSADDWRTPRLHRVGESDWKSDWMRVGSVQPYACPDHCLAVWSQLLQTATQRVALHVYDFRSMPVSDLVAEAAARVPTDVLVQDATVGMDHADRQAREEALRRIEAAGGEVVLATRGRYAFHHLKVLVADDAVAIQSDNAVPSSFPASVSWGQRGWGVVVRDEAFADQVAKILAADRAAWDVEPFEPGPPREVLRFPPRVGAYAAVPLPPFEEDVRLRLVVTPEETADPALDPVLVAVQDAAVSVRVQQLDLREGAGNALGWGAEDGMFRALVDAAGRGAQVSVQAAAPFGDGEGNRPVLDALRAAGATAVEAEGPLWLHNKGVVVDGRVVYVGSMNQNHHSRSNNRELGVLVEDERVAGWFGALYDRDVGAEPGPKDATPEGAGRQVAPWPILFATVFLLLLLRR